MNKISIIVPVFNKSQYLKECLDSLVNQTLEDIEIICIDDKSTDDSLSILLSFAEKDKRIVVVSQEFNQGVSVARNIGIKRATGEFIAFVDADDFVDLDFYERLYAVSSKYDCVKGEIWSYDTEINRCNLSSVYDLNGKIKRTGNPVHFCYGFTSAIYRKTFIDRYRFHFPEGVSYYEDPYFTIIVSTKLSAVKVVDGAKYYYRDVANSLSHHVTPQKAEEMYRSIIEILSYLRQCEMPAENRYIIANQIFSMTSTLVTDGIMNEERARHLRREYLSLLGTVETRKEAKVSVIVPIYNGGRYLRRTLDCLTMQSLHEIEIICVNDKSQDNSLDILREYQKEDKRLVVIDCKDNGGESKARNIGIRAASGKYIAFMDQDDRIDLLFYEKLHQKALETGADIAKGDAFDYSYNGHTIARQFYPIEKNPLYFSGDWWAAIYKRELLLKNGLELPEGCPLGGDLKFLFSACKKCNKVVAVHGVSYHHIMHSDSGDSETTPVHKIKSVIKVFSDILEEIEHGDLYERDKDCYVFYYNSYLIHVYMRIQRCKELEGKMLCSDFLFKTFHICRCKDEVLSIIAKTFPLLGDVLEGNRKSFFEQMLERDALSNVFYNCEGNRQPDAIPCSIVVPYVDPNLTEKYIAENDFLKKEQYLSFHLIDNRIENKAISVVYNEFLDSYDYAKESWLVFMHSDFEFLTFPSAVLSRLDKSKIYGPVGEIVYQAKGKMFACGKGRVFEKSEDNTLYENYVPDYGDWKVDTLDCQCMIIHSSLVLKYGLRFDENTVLDLYVEDFCINAKRNHQIPIEVVYFSCAHHSSYSKEKYISKRYIKQLEYVNRKYPYEIYGGTVTPIGGKLLPSMSTNEKIAFILRHQIQNGIKYE